MEYIELFGNSIKEDINEIKRAIDANNNVVFVYSGSGTLYDYITDLNDKGKGLDAEYLYKFKVCYENKALKVSYSRGNKRSRTISSMSSLVNELDGENNCRIVVETDDRVQLAFIVQQLIFIEYPLEKVDILLRKEERDADKTKRFMENGNELMKSCEKSISRLTALRLQVENENNEENPTKIDRLKDIDDALNSCYSIKEQLVKSINVELKFAVAASKKAGKSVIVNCFLGEQIAPTSTELATPNNCFYKRSIDNKYHLQLEGGSVQDFETRDEIFDVINGHFRNAQNNKENGFALPNMNIGYVTDENNFSSYTIFDTAGPDAAGTVHSEVAENAMQRCDVAVFAIDYSKYLTTSEEDYLRRVKSMFTAQNKFHSLIFALNKIDVRYTDVDSPKSFVMSVDFLKTRLANIDEAYRDCIIFPTCSLEYFSAIEAEKAGVTELNAENNLSIGDMRNVKFAHKDVPALAWLHTHSENLEYYHGMETISYDVFKKDSGMPALMSYVSYIAQSKAHDEIVNNVTFEISGQKLKIQGVLDYINNIEALINADDKKIAEISHIITDYTDSVEKVLSNDFNEDDLNVLDDNSLLITFDGDYKKMVDHQKDTLVESCKKTQVADSIYTEVVDFILKKLNGHSEFDSAFDGYQIDNFFKADDFNNIVNSVIKQKVENAAKGTLDQLTRLSEDVKKIVDRRQGILHNESDKCRERLLKENINIEFPQLPDFEFATQMTSSSETIVNITSLDLDLYDKLSGLFQKKSFVNIGRWFLKIFGITDDKDFKLTFQASKTTFMSDCEKKLKPDLKTVIYENNVPEILQEQLISSVIDKYMNGLLDELKQVFVNMNDIYKSCIDRFRSAVDDRDKYKADIALHNLRKTNIMSIGDCTSDFMQIWNVIIRDVVYEEEM